MIALVCALAIGHAIASSLPGMTQTPAAPRTIEKGEQSAIDEPKQVLVRTDAEWADLWRQHAGTRARPPIDFTKESVVAVFMGSRPTAGFNTAIVSATEGGGALIVRYTETRPGRGAISAQVITFPFHIVAVPRVTAGSVRFEKAQ